MKRILDLVGMGLGGWLGWEAGSLVSIFTGFIVGVVGSGVGMYVARRFSRGLP